MRDLEDDFDMVCLAFPAKMGGETRELKSRTWAGEDGEDTYFPAHVSTEAYDVEIELGYKGEPGTSVAAVGKLLDYLRGTSDGCSEIAFYNSWAGIGRRKAWLKEVSDEELYVDEGEEVATLTVTLRVCDPTAKVVPVVSGTGVITKLDVAG